MFLVLIGSTSEFLVQKQLYIDLFAQKKSLELTPQLKQQLK